MGAAAAVLLALLAWPRLRGIQEEDVAGASQAAYGTQERKSSPSVTPQNSRLIDTQERLPARETPAADVVVPTQHNLDEGSEPATEPRPRPNKSTRSGADTKRAAETPKAPDVVAEAKALRAIRASIRDKHAEHALGLLRRYLSRFPVGALRAEATVLRADALCLDGQREKAREVAAAFVRTHPKSPLAARARGVCRTP